MKHLALAALVLLAAGCASKKNITTATAREELESRYRDRIGSATKSDLVSEFGSAQWCKREPGGEETCRFYSKKGTKWIGEKGEDKKSFETFDEMVADFDSNGVLRSYKANSQR